MSLYDSQRFLALSPHSSAAAGGPPPLAPVDGCRLYYEADTDTLFVSLNAAAWVALAGTGGASGWTDDGTVVRLTTATDQVRIGGAVNTVGRKVMIFAEQLVTGGVDTTEAIDATITRTADLAAGEFVVGLAIRPSGRAGDNAGASVIGVFGDAPIGPAVAEFLGFFGDPVAGNFWDFALRGTDSDVVIESHMVTAAAPNDIIIRCDVPGGTPIDSFQIVAQTQVGGVPTNHWRIDGQGFVSTSAWARSGTISPVIAANQNDWTPGSVSGVSWIRVGQATGGNLNITGLAAGIPGRRITLTNASDVAAETFTLTHEDALSAAANRFHNPDLASFILARGESVELIYDQVISRWRVAAF